MTSAHTGPLRAVLRGGEPPQIPIDSNGNLSGKVEGTDNWAYTWNAENQLTKVEKNSLEQARFSYDPKGRRVGLDPSSWTSYERRIRCPG